MEEDIAKVKDNIKIALKSTNLVLKDVWDVKFAKKHMIL